MGQPMGRISFAMRNPNMILLNNLRSSRLAREATAQKREAEAIDILRAMQMNHAEFGMSRQDILVLRGRAPERRLPLEVDRESSKSGFFTLGLELGPGKGHEADIDAAGALLQSQAKGILFESGKQRQGAKMENLHQPTFSQPELWLARLSKFICNSKKE